MTFGLGVPVRLLHIRHLGEAASCFVYSRPQPLRGSFRPGFSVRDFESLSLDEDLAFDSFEVGLGAPGQMGQRFADIRHAVEKDLCCGSKVC